MRATKRISVSLPPAMARDAKRLAKREARSVSAIMRDALAQYQKSRELPDELTEEWIMQFAAEAKADRMTPQEIEAEEKRLARYGARQAKKLGIKSDEDIVRIIHEWRAEQRAQSRS